jgi:uracil-DNA glycosylase family 4
VNSAEILAKVAEEVAVCQKCALFHSRKLAVPGEGPPDAEIMFIGEGPGFYENEQGRPFVGAAGKFLDELLAAAHMHRKEVWIGNVVKCRPPSNRDPLPDELAACDDYLERQINAINPSVIVTLGRYSMGRFMPGAKISAVHGQMRKIGGRYVIAMFHPAAALHQASLKPAVVADFSKLPSMLAQARKDLGRSGDEVSAETDSPPSDPTQLSMF